MLDERVEHYVPVVRTRRRVIIDTPIWVAPPRPSKAGYGPVPRKCLFDAAPPRPIVPKSMLTERPRPRLVVDEVKEPPPAPARPQSAAAEAIAAMRDLDGGATLTTSADGGNDFC